VPRKERLTLEFLNTFVEGLFSGKQLSKTPIEKKSVGPNSDALASKAVVVSFCMNRIHVHHGHRDRPPTDPCQKRLPSNICLQQEVVETCFTQEFQSREKLKGLGWETFN
jgi:hypothetical protein